MAFNFRFPSSELDQPSRLLDLTGSFWSDVHADGALIRSLLHARARLDRQTHADLVELRQAVSRFKVPVLHTDEWYLLPLPDAGRNETDLNLPRHDGAHAYDAAHQIAYGLALPTALHCWKLPDGLRRVDVLTNRITDASLTLVRGVDYFVRDGVAVFRDNLATHPLVARQEDFAEGGGDGSLLWAYRSGWDRGNVREQFGYALDVRLPSSEAYKDFVNALFDGLVDGTTQRCVEQAVSAACGVPLAREDGEVVEHVLRDNSRLWVVTDRSAYPFHPDSEVLVAAGDVLRAGQPMTDALQFFEFGRGEVPEADRVRALSVGRGFLAAGYHQELVFENRDVPLDVTEGVDGYTRVAFELGGLPGDVEKFWDDVHAAGVAAGQTLAMLLDRRANKSGQPTAAALPATVNPLAFLCQNVFRNNLFLARVRPHLFGGNALGLHCLRHLRKLIPPHTAMILLVQLAARGDEIIMDGDGGEGGPGYAEGVAVFLGGAIAEEVDAGAMIEESVRARSVRGRCE